MPSSENETSLRDLLVKLIEVKDYLLGRWKMIAAFIVVGALLGLTLALILPPVYKAELVFVLENDKEKASDIASIASKFGLSVGGSSGGLFRDDENIMAIMTSRTMITKTLFSKVKAGGKEEYLVDRYVAVNGFRKRWKELMTGISFHPDPAHRSLTEDSLLGVFSKMIVEENLSVAKPDRKGTIIVASTNSVDELFAKSFTEALIENVTNFYIQTVTKKSQDNVNILYHQVDSVRHQLNYALSGVAFSSDANPNPNPAFQRLKVNAQRRMVDVEMNKAILEELVKNFELAKIGLRRETPLISIIDKPVLPLEKKKLGKLKGVVVGGFIAGLLIVAYLCLGLLLRKILNRG